ncbi:MAG: dihydroxyacetone kinase subunit L [Verrucomicrobia bacterium]|nr:dihydroxyacetone kinase subunit L [Verrucomicrobiota bacterium]
MKLNVEQTRRLVSRALEAIATKRDYLNELDRGLGDGDHGTTVARGVKAAVDLLDAARPASANEVFTSTGSAMMKSMGGASGVLFGTFFLGAKACPDAQELDTGTLLAFFKSGLNNLKQKTKAQRGDKTMLDALVPAVDALAQDDQESRPLDAALKHAADAAEQGAKSTVGLLPRFGRARTLGERATAVQDPGATSVSLFVRGLSDHVSEAHGSGATGS